MTVMRVGRGSRMLTVRTRRPVSTMWRSWSGGRISRQRGRSPGRLPASWIRRFARVGARTRPRGCDCLIRRSGSSGLPDDPEPALRLLEGGDGPKDGAYRSLSADVQLRMIRLAQAEPDLTFEERRGRVVAPAPANSVIRLERTRSRLATHLGRRVPCERRASGLRRPSIRAPHEASSRARRTHPLRGG